MSAIDTLIKIKFFGTLFEIGFSNHDSVSHRPISELKRDLNLHSLLTCPFSRQ